MRPMSIKVKIADVPNACGQKVKYSAQLQVAWVQLAPYAVEAMFRKQQKMLACQYLPVLRIYNPAHRDPTAADKEIGIR